MIQAWRVCRAPFADLSGEGARRYGGRWNSPGLPAVYAAEHPALALLEVRVHLDLPLDLMPEDYVILRISLPDEPPEHITTIPPDPRAAGDAWLREARTAILRVPSILVPGATNLLLNSRHSRATEAILATPTPFRFDPRLWSA